MFGRREVLKSICIAVLALILLVYSTFSWYNFRTPGAITIGIDDPTANIIIEKFNEANGQYELVQSVGNSFLIDIPPITFYEWLGQLVSTFGENLQYRIKVTGNFRALGFAKKPLFNVNSHLSVISGVTQLQSIKILKAEYRVSTPTESLAYFQNDFPSSGFLNLFPTNVPATTITPIGTSPPEIIYENILIFPNVDFPSEVEDVILGGVERFQSIFYLRITPDSDAVAGIINSLASASGVPQARNTLTLNFGFRSVPYYSPPTPTPSQ